MASTRKKKEVKMISELSNQGKGDGVKCMNSAGISVYRNYVAVTVCNSLHTGIIIIIGLREVDFFFLL